MLAHNVGSINTWLRSELESHTGFRSTAICVDRYISLPGNCFHHLCHEYYNTHPNDPPELSGNQMRQMMWKHWVLSYFLPLIYLSRALPRGLVWGSLPAGLCSPCQHHLFWHNGVWNASAAECHPYPLGSLQRQTEGGYTLYPGPGEKFRRAQAQGLWWFLSHDDRRLEASGCGEAAWSVSLWSILVVAFAGILSFVFHIELKIMFSTSVIDSAASLWVPSPALPILTLWGFPSSPFRLFILEAERPMGRLLWGSAPNHIGAQMTSYSIVNFSLHVSKNQIQTQK